MPVDKKLKQKQLEANSAGKLELNANSFRNSNRKAPGTRYGTVIDWREGSTKPEKTSRYGDAVRDGR